MKKTLNIQGENKQILLCNTQRETDLFLKSLDTRNNGKYKKIPNFVIKKDGKVVELHTEDVTTFFLPGYKIRRGVIVIALENRGWLKRRTQDGKYVDWLGDIYHNKVFEKKWRGKIFWDVYSDPQTKQLIELVNKICKKYRIPKESMGHNVLVEGVENFKGIVSRSNYNEYWTDINPSFNFELI